MAEQFDGFEYQSHDVDVCVVGGGMAGLCAAIASARRGSRTLLVQDRPVLGGNASSEVRMWVCGAHGNNTKETGLLEEIQLDNAHINPGGNYSVWDAVLWNAAVHQENLVLLLNCSVCDGQTEPVSGQADQRQLSTIRAWQTTSQTWHTIAAKIFIDCSGDSVLAPISGAQTRWGREARSEFDEDIEPATPDGKTMGNTLLIQIRRTDGPVPFIPPPFAHVFNSPDDLPHRIRGVQGSNFWWIELGGLKNTIHQAEEIQRDLMPAVWGIWDYIKNRAPEHEQAANWAIEFIGSLPGKRENRRYVGDHTLCQNEVRAATTADYFPDSIAYGGWSMDDHHPAGLLYPGKPTIFHPAPSPYNIPYRTLYSRNVVNLMCAGRNISVTHAALSSTRVMATCALLGQAAGTAAAMAVQRRIRPGQVFPNHIAELQNALMNDDQWLPGRARTIDPLAVNARCDFPQLLNGHDRTVAGVNDALDIAIGRPISFSWDKPTRVRGVRAVFDSNLANDKRMPSSYPQKHDRASVPASLVKSFRVEAKRADGTFETIHKGDNHQRLCRLELDVTTEEIRFVAEGTWGAGQARLFSLEPVSIFDSQLPPVPVRRNWSDIVAAQKPQDLAPPEGVTSDGPDPSAGVA